MNKKVIIASMLFALIAPVLFGQAIIAGAKLGADFPFFLGDDFNAELDATGFDTQFMIGFTGGAFLTWEIFDYLALQPEVLFTMAGSSIGTGDTREVTKINYIEIPVLIKGTLPTAAGKFGIYTGPDFMFQVGDATFVNEDGDTIDGPPQDAFNTFVFNMVFGVDYNVPLGPGNLFVDVRYNLGITPIFDQDVVDAYRYTQNIVQVYLGYGVRVAEFSLF